MEDLKTLCGDLGGYEADFLYICSFLSAYDGPMKSPDWTFVGLRSALESSKYDVTLKNIMRRCFVLASRNIIGGVDDENDSRMDRAIVRLIADRPLEASILLHGSSLPDLESVGFLSLNFEQRARIVRFIMQSTFESPHMVLQGADVSSTLVVGADSEGWRYFLVKDKSLEIGCWKEIDNHGSVELIATSTDALITASNALRASSTLPDRTRDFCVYCRKKVPSNVDSQLCAGCAVGACHSKCLPSKEIDGLSWCCSSDCKQVALANYLRDFANEIEPQQKAAARKKRRIASELSSLQISAKDYGVSETRRRASTTTRGGRISSSVDYSFRDYDRAISDAIRKSERKSASEPYSSEEDVSYKQPSRSLSRDERMALRNQRFVEHEPRAMEQTIDVQMSQSDESPEVFDSQEPSGVIESDDVGGTNAVDFAMPETATTDQVAIDPMSIDIVDNMPLEPVTQDVDHLVGHGNEAQSESSNLNSSFPTH